MKLRAIISIPIIIIGVLIAFGPQTIFPVCSPEGDMIMKCFWTARAALGTGLAITVLGLLGLIIPNLNVLAGLELGVLLNGVLVILYPTALIGVCTSAEMHCHSLTQPALVILGAILIVWTAVTAIYLFRKYQAQAKKENTVPS